MPDTTIHAHVTTQNQHKVLFTAGPASLLEENLLGLRPCFGRGDQDYSQVEDVVLSALKTMTDHAHIARLQGSASLALEIASLNFLYGKVLVIDSGYYAQRLVSFAQMAQRNAGEVSLVTVCDWQQLANVTGHYDWVVACYTETSAGLLLPIADLRALADRVGAQLMLDATASIGLENDHGLADVIAYSSCKGLFGLTGASFIAFHQSPRHAVDSFYLNLATHLERRMTGPYHAIASLYEVLPKHDDLREAVFINKAQMLKKIAAYATHPVNYQPVLCTWVDAKVSSQHARAVLYQPRGISRGSVVCHLGEAHLGSTARGAILDLLELQP
ncbi:aminotransferase class V-fold PLP-dependent enzyme [Methylophilus sp. Q8]|uniref:aminotransferase class V-fold PLP-dependent enzyme n=1 Tax=Methylophilus sp. Q8 TaxID=1506586 RepID=UPI0006489450|nr:aminotransferase class V-fold PLP-dependent enzyme [Methylophilus sp. Q8]